MSLPFNKSQLLRLLSRNLAFGVLAGWMTLALMLANNTGGLYDVVFGSANPFLPLVLLAFGFTVTFGSLAMGAAIMLLPYDNDRGKGRGLKVHTLLASLIEQFDKRTRAQVPVPVRVRGRRTKRPGKR